MARKSYVSNNILVSNPVSLGDFQYRIRIYDSVEALTNDDGKVIGPKPGVNPTAPKVQIQSNQSSYGAPGKDFFEWSPTGRRPREITQVFMAIMEDLVIMEEIHETDLLPKWEAKYGGQKATTINKPSDASAVAAYERIKAQRSAEQRPATVSTPVQAQTVKRQGRGGR